VDVRESSRHVRVTANGGVIAETDWPKLLSETALPNRFYIPREDVREDILGASTKHSVCPYKGTASYCTLQLEDQQIEDAAWFYPEPLEDAIKVRDHLCFLADGIVTEVDGEPIA
jgi:uncharacterized protein (DUF427 family)